MNKDIVEAVRDQLKLAEDNLARSRLQTQRACTAGDMALYGMYEAEVTRWRAALAEAQR